MLLFKKIVNSSKTLIFPEISLVYVQLGLNRYYFFFAGSRIEVASDNKPTSSTTLWSLPRNFPSFIMVSLPWSLMYCLNSWQYWDGNLLKFTLDAVDVNIGCFHTCKRDRDSEKGRECFLAQTCRIHIKLAVLFTGVLNVSTTSDDTLPRWLASSRRDTPFPRRRLV